jgi:hypothetical protein
MKKIEPLCKNCLLYDFEKSICKVIVLHEGLKINLPTNPEDICFFENEFTAINKEGKSESFKVDVKEIKLWVEDPITGKKADKGIVKIEYPSELDSTEPTSNA